jgi:N-methylhydantoinase A
VSFGGAGGLHANALAELLGCYPVIVPSESGVLSALGFVASDIKNEVSQTLIRATADADAAEIRGNLEELAATATSWLDDEGVAKADQQIAFVAEMRYQRQGFEIPIPIAAEEVAGLDVGELADRFATAHNQLYGFDLEGGSEIVCLRALATGRVPELDLAAGDRGSADPSSAQKGTQTVWSSGSPEEVPSYDRAQLRPGMRLTGYAIVEQYDATTVVLPGHVATVDAFGNLIIRPEGEAQ